LTEKPDDKLIPDYQLEDKSFQSLVQAVVLGTYTYFDYAPSNDEAKILYGRMKKVAVASLEGKDLSLEENKEMKQRLKCAESKLLYIHRHCKGDASETGLVQFAQAIQNLDNTRAKYPTHVYQSAAGKETECLIPFSSDIKFNAFIRDMSADGGNLQIFLKGAPERVLNRCSKILMNGEEVEFTQKLRDGCNEANKSFGALGERVLAFARMDLPADKYPKDSYQFDMKSWKEWGLKVDQQASDYENV
jgi:magnesium-transporting ATPase (P-type)